MLIENCDYFVRIIPFPDYKVGGMVMPNDNGTFSVYLNSRLSQERQKQALEHELEHILNNDFYNGVPIHEIEEV